MFPPKILGDFLGRTRFSECLIFSCIGIRLNSLHSRVIFSTFIVIFKDYSLQPVVPAAPDKGTGGKKSAKSSVLRRKPDPVNSRGIKKAEAVVAEVEGKVRREEAADVVQELLEGKFLDVVKEEKTTSADNSYSKVHNNTKRGSHPNKNIGTHDFGERSRSRVCIK